VSFSSSRSSGDTQCRSRKAARSGQDRRPHGLRARHAASFACLALALGAASPASGDAVETEIARLEAEAAFSAARLDPADPQLPAARDRELDRARRGRALEGAADSIPGWARDRALPGSMSARAIAIAIDGYVRALSIEAAIRSGRGSPETGRREPSRFPAIWNEAAGHILEVLGRWPSLWSRGMPAAAAELDLPSLLLSLCVHEAFLGEAYALPREDLTLRMATLPESLAVCCLDLDRCRDVGGGADCPRFVEELMAVSVDQDAMTGFRYGARYWSLAAEAPPRSRSSDGRVAAATARFLGEWIEAGEIDRLERPGPADERSRTAPQGNPPLLSEEGSVREEEALDLIRSGGKLWPPAADPFSSVPGLRNPRWSGTGALLCDVAIYRPCLEALHPRTREWLNGRLTGGRKIIAIEPR
jgi:hypothetical protein